MARLRLEYVFVLLLIASNLIIPPLIDSKTNTLSALPLEARLALKNNVSSGYIEYGSIYEELRYNLKSEVGENNTRDYYVVTYSNDFVELSSQKLTGFAFPSTIGGFIILDKIDDTIVISQSNGQGSFFIYDSQADEITLDILFFDMLNGEYLNQLTIVIPIISSNTFTQLGYSYFVGSNPLTNSMLLFEIGINLTIYNGTAGFEDRIFSLWAISVNTITQEVDTTELITLSNTMVASETDFDSSDLTSLFLDSEDGLILDVGIIEKRSSVNLTSYLIHYMNYDINQKTVIRKEPQVLQIEECEISSCKVFFNLQRKVTATKIDGIDFNRTTTLYLPELRNDPWLISENFYDYQFYYTFQISDYIFIPAELDNWWTRGLNATELPNLAIQVLGIKDDSKRTIEFTEINSSAYPIFIGFEQISNSRISLSILDDSTGQILIYELE